MEQMQHDYLLVNQARILYNQSATTLFFPVIACLALCLLLWDVAGHRRLLAWAGAVIIYTMLRYIIIRQQRHREITPANAGKWLDVFTVGALFSGILWGAAAVVLVPYRPDSLVRFTLYNGLTLLIICGLVAGAVISYSVSRWVLFFYAFPALALPGFYLISLGDLFNSALGGYVLLYLMFIVISSFRLNGQYRYYMNMEFKLARLLEERQAQKPREAMR